MVGPFWHHRNKLDAVLDRSCCTNPARGSSAVVFLPILHSPVHIAMGNDGVDAAITHRFSHDRIPGRTIPGEKKRKDSTDPNFYPFLGYGANRSWVIVWKCFFDRDSILQCGWAIDPFALPCGG